MEKKSDHWYYGPQRSQGLTVPGRTYRRPRYQRQPICMLKMHLLQANSRWMLNMSLLSSGLVHTAYLYAVMDIFSRYKQGIILPLLDQRLAIEALKQINPNLTFETDFIQTDNGLEFQKAFQDFVKNELGWKHRYIHKSSPNENAVIERSLRTDEEEFFWRMEKTPKDLIELNEMYQDYLKYYNEYRPHLGIDLKTPLGKLQSVQ